MNDEILNDRLKNADPSRDSGVQVEVLMQEQQWVTSLIASSSGSHFARLWKSASRARKAFFASVAVLLLGIFGTGSTLVARNMLDDSSIQAINESDCNVSGTNARLVRKGTDSIGSEIEYWTVGSNSSVVDLVIRSSDIDGAAGGTNSCDHHARKEGEPFVSWSGYATNDRIWHVAFFGWAPARTIGKLHLSNDVKITLRPDANGNVFELLEPGEMKGVFALYPEIFDSSGQLLNRINLNPEEK